MTFAMADIEPCSNSSLRDDSEGTGGIERERLHASIVKDKRGPLVRFGKNSHGTQCSE